MTGKGINNNINIKHKKIFGSLNQTTSQLKQQCYKLIKSIRVAEKNILDLTPKQT